jgi:hypothetical protein
LDNWHLPTRREVATLIDTGHAASLLAGPFDPLLMDPSFTEAFYWTSTVSAANTGNAWVVRFVPIPSQGVDVVAKSTLQYGRALCVAGTPTFPTKPVLTLDNEVVHDATTKLTWQRTTDKAPMMPWVQAVKYCQGLIANNAGGFRLPNVKELLSLVDDSLDSLAIDPVFMLDPMTPRFWTSSPHPPNPASAWTVEFTHGKVSPDGISGAINRVRCVR